METRRVMINDDVQPIAHQGLPFPDGRYRESYRIFHRLAEEQDFPMVFASPYDFDVRGGVLRGWWEPTRDGWRSVEEPLRPAFVFDKASGTDPHCDAVIQYFDLRGVPIFDPPALSRLCGSKWPQYLQFPDRFPLSDLLPQDPDRLVPAIHAFFERLDRADPDHQGRAVVKPLYGYQSRGIHRIAQGPYGLEMHMLFGGQLHGADIQRNLDAMVRTPYLIQAWVDTSGGIPEIDFHGPEHDVRFIFRIKQPRTAEFVLSYLKTLQGMLYYPVEAYGPEPFAVVEPVADWMAEHFEYGIFCVDVMRDRSGRWLLTELNDQVGLTMRFDSDWDVNSMTYFMRVIIGDMKRVHETARP